VWCRLCFVNSWSSFHSQVVWWSEVVATKSRSQFLLNLWVAGGQILAVYIGELFVHCWLLWLLVCMCLMNASQHQIMRCFRKYNTSWGHRCFFSHLPKFSADCYVDIYTYLFSLARVPLSHACWLVSVMLSDLGYP